MSDFLTMFEEAETMDFTVLESGNYTGFLESVEYKIGNELSEYIEMVYNIENRKIWDNLYIVKKDGTINGVALGIAKQRLISLGIEDKPNSKEELAELLKLATNISIEIKIEKYIDTYNDKERNRIKGIKIIDSVLDITSNDLPF